MAALVLGMQLGLLSVRDRGAAGDGLADDTAAFTAAVTSGAKAVGIPRGTYRLTGSVDVPAGVALIGEGRNASILKAEHNGHLLSWSGAEYVNGALYGACLELPATSTGAGLRVQGNMFQGSDIRVRGGGAAAWGIELDKCNVFDLANVIMWGDGGDAFKANGFRLRNSTDALVNYGDGSLSQLDIRLETDNTKGLYFEGPTAVANILNNVLVAKANIIAPNRTGCRAVHIRNARRLTFVSLDIESIGEGVYEEGTAADRTELNAYLGVYCLGVTTPYADSNGTISRSVFNRTFIGCDNFPALAGPGSAVMADGDAMLAKGLWFVPSTTGKPDVLLGPRSGVAGVLQVTDGADVGGLRFTVSGSNPEIAPTESGATGGNDVRVSMGRSDNTMRGFWFYSPATMPPRSTAPVSPSDGMLAYADGSGWNPKGDGTVGLFVREAGTWKKVTAS